MSKKRKGINQQLLPSKTPSKDKKRENGRSSQEKMGRTGDINTHRH